MKIEQIMTKVKNEKMRSDKMFTGIEFNVRDEQVVMNYVYADYGSGEGTNTEMYMPHGGDPEFISEEEMNMLIEKLRDKNIGYNIRKDDFI
ncbi:hypothetical protein BN1048_00396 [Jeotgalicoccus saudimassiliensis]|uniref:Uncharacterized protein n=1 Tax=Jeotgalicoccus saudimassiliensis TaxID=1461582 RepID=A0A078M3J0_9STAP|nr:hypothetical protein [Jeotgalicoccus saudimassiliensis]CDZ99301.1 hypothetical protein BN1048_00396 [Jeotgalicoccus saudimassiliensis]